MNNKNIKSNKQRAKVMVRFTSFYMLLIALLFGLSSSMAQPRNITLKEVIDLTIKNSHVLQADKAGIDEAVASVKQAQENRLPTLNVSGSYLRLNSANVDLKTKSNNNSGGTTGTTPKISQ